VGIETMYSVNVSQVALLFIGGILGSIQAEGPVFQWAKSLDGNPGNGGDNAHSFFVHKN